MTRAAVVLLLWLCSLVCAHAQRRCDPCMQDGLSVFYGRWVYDRNENGLMIFSFRNSGNSNWKVEKIYCEFFDRQNRLIYSRSFDMARFEVSARTQRRDTAPYTLPQAVPDMKTNCWIESAFK